MNDKKIDPFLASVIHGALEDIALEMGQIVAEYSWYIHIAAAQFDPLMQFRNLHFLL